MKYLLLLLSFILIQYAQSEPLLVPATKDQISEEQARLEMARLLNNDERAQEAINQYKKLIEMDPTIFSAYIELAQIYATQNNLDVAKTLLAKIPQEKLGEKGKLTIAAIAETEGNFTVAQAIYEKLLVENDSQVTRFKLAGVLAWQKDYQASIAQYKKLVEARPNDVQLLRHYAQVLGWNKQFKEAIAVWEKALPNE